MDAKKISEYVKPRYFKGTPANRLCYIVASISVSSSLLITLLYYSWCKKYDRTPLSDFIAGYLVSDDYKMRQFLQRCGLPPSRKLYEKVMRGDDEDLDDSALFCKSLTHKRKANGGFNPKHSKQLKLSVPQSSNNSNEDNHAESNQESTGSQIWDTKLNRSKSTYFTTKKSPNTCPLCFKTFKTDSTYSAHMKQCAKTHKLTTQQLLGALELQKKQMKERREMGLSSQKISLPVRTKKKDKDNDACDLALGLALSKSLTTGDPKSAFSKDVQKSTLEEFGFTHTNLVPGPSRRKDQNKKSVLKERTTEERQRIIIEKVAIVLLDEDQEKTSKIRKPASSPHFLNKRVPQLWNKGENNEKQGWYVDGIKALVLPEQENTEKECKTPPVSVIIDDEITKLNLPLKGTYKDWGNMINNEKLSDVTIKTKDCRDVYLHSLVMFVRCPDILEKDYKAIFSKFSFSTIVIFLQYLYCGTLDGLTRTEISQLLDLAMEFNYGELIDMLNCLKNYLLRASETVSTSLPVEIEVKTPEVVAVENKKSELLEDRDLFAEEKTVNLTQSSSPLQEEDNSENESNVEKSYWSFIQHEKKKQASEEMKTLREWKIQETETLDAEETSLANKLGMKRILSDDSATKDLDEIKKIQSEANSDCIILSSGSEAKPEDENVENAEASPSPVACEVPFFDPYDNFHCFSEEQFSPVGLHSQSLITGDVSVESVKVPEDGETRRSDGSEGKEPPEKALAYCSTPVTVRQTFKITSSSRSSIKKRKRCDLSTNRILRKSLGLEKKMRGLGSTKKSKKKKNESSASRDFAEALTNSILHELSRSAFPLSPSPSRRRMFVEMTPIPGRDELVDAVTPSPNYSNMGESMLKEQLTKYGLKRNLAKSKAKKILRHIYEELHPLYNAETGKIVKKISGCTPKEGKKAKSVCRKNTKSKQATAKSKPEQKRGIHCDSPKEREDASDKSIDRMTDCDSEESEFETLSKTLTQSVSSNPLDLPSAFCDFLENNLEYHEKILLYEPIWLEDLQRKLKESFKKHFKLSDLMDYLDQMCITFRSEAQARNMQRRNEKKKRKAEKRKEANVMDDNN